MCKTLGVSSATPSHLLTFCFQGFFASVIQGFPTSFGWLIHAFLQSFLVFFPSHDVVIWVACPGFFCPLQEHFPIFFIVPLFTSAIPLFNFFARQRHDFNIWKIFFFDCAAFETVLCNVWASLTPRRPRKRPRRRLERRNASAPAGPP